jgi:hypothetical protein
VRGDVRSLFAELGVRLLERDGLNLPVHCFANPGAHKQADRNASASVNTETGAWCCHACGAKGGAYDAAVAVGRSPREAMALLERHGLTGQRSGACQRPTSIQTFPLRVTDADVRRWARNLLSNGPMLERLEEWRGWHWAAIERLEVGYDGRWVTFPYRDAAGRLVGVGRYNPNPNRRPCEPKLKADKGSRRELYPAPERVREESWLFLLEGEPDAVRAASLALPAVGVPGVHGWRPESVQRFRGRRLVICFDCDRAGRAAAQRVVRELVGVATEVRLLDFDTRDESGFDFSDWTRLARTPSERLAVRRILLDAAEWGRPACDYEGKM